MNKILTLVCCVGLASSGFAEILQPRNEKEIKKLVKSLPANDPVVINETWGKSKDVSLKKLDTTSLNDIEMDLLDRYADVILFSETPNCYYAVDENGCIGVCDLNGKEVVPPLEGHIRVCAGLHAIFVGDACENDAWSKTVFFVVTTASGTGAGHLGNGRSELLMGKISARWELFAKKPNLSKLPELFLHLQSRPVPKPLAGSQVRSGGKDKNYRYENETGFIRLVGSVFHASCIVLQQG